MLKLGLADSSMHPSLRLLICIRLSTRPIALWSFTGGAIISI